MLRNVCRSESSVCFFCGIEGTKIHHSSTYIDVRPKTINQGSNASKTGSRGFAVGIVKIHNTGHVPQVAEPVVIAVAVDVINIMLRPLTTRKKPCQTMRKEPFPIHSDIAVSVRVDSSRDLSGNNSVRAILLNLPNEVTRYRVVIKLRLQFVLSDHRLVSFMGGRHPSRTGY